MNALTVLCHFCEQHGPSVVMCTQPYRQPFPRSTHNGTGVDSQSSDQGRIRKNSSAVMGAGGDGYAADGSAFASEASAAPGIFRTSPVTSQLLFPTPSTCRACSFSMRDEPGLISYDQVTCTSYVSTQWPRDPDLLNFVLTACQRSLSCEVCPGPDGAFYFGDEVNGHVISYNFQVQDAQARGLKSQYSFLVLSWDRVYLMNLWPFLVSNLTKMANRIQQAASQVYTAEINASSSSTAGATGSGPLTARQLCLAHGATPPAGLTGISGGPHVRQRRAADADMRSLATLTKDDQIFCRIHAWFTWLLRAGARRWTALPSYTAPVNEDAMVEQEERQAVMVNGSDGLFGGDLGSLTSLNLTAHSIPSRGIFGTGHTGVGKCLGLTGDSAEEESNLVLQVLVRLLNSLGVRPFSSLAQHVVVGNQLVVQPLTDNLLGCLTVSAFSKLLPRGCIKQIIMSPDYLPPFRCNLLSLTADAKPADPEWRPDEGIRFITVYRNRSDTPGSVDEFVQSLHFRVCTTLPSMDPSLDHLRTSKRSLEVVAPSVITGPPPVVSSYVTRIVQLLSIDPPLPPGTLELAIAEVRLEWISRAKLLFAFKRCQGPSLTGDETTKRWTGVLATIDCSAPENASVVLFWQGALSQHSRQNPCHSKRKASTSNQASRRTSMCSSNADLTAALAAASLTE